MPRIYVTNAAHVFDMGPLDFITGVAAAVSDMDIDCYVDAIAAVDLEVNT